MRDRARLEDFLIPVLVTALGAFRTTMQLVIGGPWGFDATLGVIVLAVGLVALAIALRDARAQRT